MPRYTPRYRAMRSRHAHRAFSWRRPGARAVGLVAALLAVVCLAAFTMAPRVPTTHGSAATNVARHFVRQEGFPDVARWQDESQKTAFSIRLRAPAAASVKGSANQTGQTGFSAAIGNTYSFTLPSGDQVVGEVFPTRQPNGDFDVAGCQVARLVTRRPQQVVATLSSHFDAHALVAFAQLGFVVAASVDGSSQLAALCKKATGNTFTMQSGCDPSGVCVDPVATASVALPHYENQLIAANKAPSPASWQQVYDSSSGVIRGQYSSGQFADAMARAIEKVGKITAIAPVPETIVVQTSSTGQSYFIAHSDVTFSLKGQSSTRRITSYYLLEGGQWRFWFSA
jgi:hypothetical protein